MFLPPDPGDVTLPFPAMHLPVLPPVEPMLARLARTLPTGALVYEPKWDGFRCLVFRDGDTVVLQSRNAKPLGRYFPEVLEPLGTALPERCVVDGELVVPVGGRLDFDAISERIHPAASRVAALAERTPAHFVAFDVLAVGDRDVRSEGFAERRARLLDLLPAGHRRVHVTPATEDASVAADWFERFEGAGFDGVVAKHVDLRYEPGARSMHKVKHERTADVVVGGFRWHKSSTPAAPAVGSLLLGLHDRTGSLRHVGVAASFSDRRRRELVDELAPFRLPSQDASDHPWMDGPSGADTTPRGGHRWNAQRDMSWEPLRIALVAEVAYEGLQADRFRHTARFKRWRPDRDPASATYEQLDVPTPAELAQVLAEDRTT